MYGWNNELGEALQIKIIEVVGISKLVERFPSEQTHGLD